ncbi:MAG TPA: STAS domain-containing protein [Solirubrobacterales bacterium]|nr:STAS domain-containing protein [Solirubrobacterales bacterium]
MPDSDAQAQDGLLHVIRADEGAHVRLSLSGELDLSNAPTVEVSLDSAIDSGKKVLVDLDGLEFIDSTGLALIVRLLGRNDAERFSFVPSRSAAVRRVLNLTGLDERMVIATTTTEQLAAIPPA